MYKQLFCNSSLKEINNTHNINFSLPTEYSDIVKYILSSNKHLDKFKVKCTGIDQFFFESIRKSETIPEIKIFILITIYHDSILEFINNAYLFKTETIKIETSKGYMKDIIDRILKLSNNPLNTVKRIIIDNHHNDFISILSGILNSHKYDVKKIPKIFIDFYKEVKIEYDNNDYSYKINCLYIDRKYKYYYDFKLSFKGNSLNEKDYTQLLYLIFNCPGYFRSLEIDYYEKNANLEAIRQHIKENTEKVVYQMMIIFNKLLAENVYFSNPKINYLAFKFIKSNPELNIFYFTILEIMIQLKIKINELRLESCPIIDLVIFMNKHKTLESLNIDNINLKVTETNEEDIDKLYLYSHLIEGKIRLEGIDLPSKEFTDFYSKLINKSNFICIHDSKSPITHISDINFFYLNDDIIRYIEINQKEHEMIVKDDILSQKIRYYDFYMKHLDFKVLYRLISFLKEYYYFLNQFYFKMKLDTDNHQILRKIISMYFETNLDCQYRYRKNCLHHSNVGGSNVCRKINRYLKLHNISNVGMFLSQKETNIILI